MKTFEEIYKEFGHEFPKDVRALLKCGTETLITEEIIQGKLKLKFSGMLSKDFIEAYQKSYDQEWNCSYNS